MKRWNYRKGWARPSWAWSICRPMWSTRRLIDRHRPNSASTSACTRYQLWRHNTAAARVCKSNGEGMHASEISTTRLERNSKLSNFRLPVPVKFRDGTIDPHFMIEMWGEFAARDRRSHKEAGTKIVEMVACRCTVRLKMYARSLFF